MAHNQVIKVINDEGRPFYAKLVRPVGPDLGSGRLLRNPTMPIVEFYDGYYEDDPKFGPLGQFTGGHYYVADLLQHPRGRGLILYGGVSAWRLDAEAVARVQRWLRAECLEAGDQQSSDAEQS